jgi:hypothetical protein
LEGAAKSPVRRSASQAARRCAVQRGGSFFTDQS